MKKINYKFKNPHLLKMAFTHSSFSNQNYERLEFLGDSILDFIVADFFYKKTDENEGSLTKLRSSFVSEKYLSDIFDQLDLSKNVITGKSFKGQLSNAIKADIIEAVIASIYLDCQDMKLVKNFVTDLLKLDLYKTVQTNDYKTELQEYVQAKNSKVEYKLIKKEGLSHNPIWTMGVYLNNQLIGQGQEKSKHRAEQIAAKYALCLLKGEKND